MINQEKFKELLTKAIGGNTQVDFANACGLSKFTLNRYLSQGLKVSPRAKTLVNIANASEGRVSSQELLEAAGFTDEEIAELADSDTKENVNAVNLKKYQLIAMEFHKNLNDCISKRIKGNSVEEWMDTFNMLYGDSSCTFKFGEEKEYTKNLYSGADYLMSVTVKWVDIASNTRYNLVFALLYCWATGNSVHPKEVVVCDSAFSLEELRNLNIDESGLTFLQAVMTDGSRISDYPVCVTAEKIQEM